MPSDAMTTTAIATQTKPDRRWRRGLRHGLRSRHMPFKGGSSIEKYRNEYRKAVEDELLAQGREIGVAEATTVAAAVVAYEHALKAGFWLANNHDELNHDQRLAFSREEMRGLAEAAKLLKQLDIDRNKTSASVWQTLESHQRNGHAASRDATDTGVQVATRSDNAAVGRTEAESESV
jgi:hypothetical protein